VTSDEVVEHALYVVVLLLSQRANMVALRVWNIRPMAFPVSGPDGATNERGAGGSGWLPGNQPCYTPGISYPRYRAAGHPLDGLAFPLPSSVGAWIVYSYFTWIDPAGAGLRATRADIGTFVGVTTLLIVGSSLLAAGHFGPVLAWARRLRGGAAPTEVPLAIRHRLLNAPLWSAALTAAGWTLAGLFYLARQRWWMSASVLDAWRVFVGIAVVGGPVAAALSFLVAEFYWRRRIPLFYPTGHLDRGGVIRVPILVRLGATFFVMAALPPFLMLLVTTDLVGRLGSGAPPLLERLLGIHAYIAVATGAVSVATALLVARFINRPVQALRLAMARVAAGELSAEVPVRSTDELGELSDGFNAMVAGLREAERARDLFGRYVSPMVARQALERGVTLGGETTRATAMFVDLRGFTALSQRLPADRLVGLLNEYYALVEDACEPEGGVISQFLGDGIVIVFGAPLKPLPDHARGAVCAALAVQRRLAARNRTSEQPLRAGIGICTGEMIAGNVGAAGRVTYTIVGDAVNQAARLQVKTRDLGVAVLVTESTRAALGAAEGFALRSCGAVPLKGIAAPVTVYAVHERGAADDLTSTGT
jgi:adenylate cyclase